MHIIRNVWKMLRKYLAQAENFSTEDWTKRKQNSNMDKTSEFLLFPPCLRPVPHEDSCAVRLKERKSLPNPFKLRLGDARLLVLRSCKKDERKKFTNCIKEHETRISFHRHLQRLRLSSKCVLKCFPKLSLMGCFHYKTKLHSFTGNGFGCRLHTKKILKWFN